MSAACTCTPLWLWISAAWACATPSLRVRGIAWPSYISFLFCNNLFKFMICLSLTFKYLNSLTLSIKSWHSCIAVVETIDTSFDLHMSLCLSLLSRRLSMDLTLPCKRSLSAFLIIFLAFSVLIVVFNLILTGVIPLLIHLSVNI